MFINSGNILSKDGVLVLDWVSLSSNGENGTFADIKVHKPFLRPGCECVEILL